MPADSNKGPPRSSDWKVRASDGAMNTSNPIREIIETMNLAENPAKKVIPLSIGDPTIFGNLRPCHAILDAIQRANASGKYYGYQTAAGMESARKAVARYHNKCTGDQSVSEQDVILASGCSHALDLCICVLARQGQSILIPRPGFPLYKTLTSVYGVKFKQYNLLADKNWSIDLDHLESLIDAQTAAIVINNPSNPCGSVFSKRHLLEILELAERHRLPIISDEIYDKFVFSPELYAGERAPVRSATHESDRDLCGPPEAEADAEADADADDDDDSGHYEEPATETVDENTRPGTGGGPRRHQTITCKSTSDSGLELADSASEPARGRHGGLGAKQHFRYVRFRSLASLSDTVPILTCGGISKTCLIPGLRLGWIIINDKKSIFDASIRQGLSRLTQRLMGPNSLVQGALHDILTNVPDDFYKETMDFIFQNAKLCYERLLNVRGLNPYMPQGSMYLMVGFEPKLFPDIDGDLDFTSKLMNEQSVLVLPGKCFDFPNFFRICLTVPTIVMEDALDRIEEFCNHHARAATKAGDKTPIESANHETLQQSLGDITKDLKQQQQRFTKGSSKSNRQHYTRQHHQHTAAPMLHKKPFDLTGNLNGNQQLAISKCK